MNSTIKNSTKIRRLTKILTKNTFNILLLIKSIQTINNRSRRKQIHSASIWIIIRIIRTQSITIIRIIQFPCNRLSNNSSNRIIILLSKRLRHTTNIIRLNQIKRLISVISAFQTIKITQNILIHLFSRLEITRQILLN